jgi:predicted transcriptional regulator
MKIHIDPEFAALIPEVSEAHAKELEDAVLADGQFLNPLVVWRHKNTLLDGHRRHKIHTKHPTLPMPKPIVLDFETRDEAHDWIIRHQLSKRNITEEQRRYLIGKLYLDKKLAAHRPAGDKVVTLTTLSDGKTAEKIAKSEGVTEKTVRNAADFAAAVDAVKVVAPSVASAVLAGEVKATTKDLEALAELPKREANKVDREIAAGDSTSVKAAVSKISGGTTFNVKELEAATAVAERPHRNGKPVVGSKTRKECLVLHGKLCRALKAVGIYEEFIEPLSQIIKRLKEV